MNNQVKLIDANKVVARLKEKLAHEQRDPYCEYRIERAIAYEDMINEIQSTDHFFDPDTPPVPTIKPGDKVKHKRDHIPGIGEVKQVNALCKFGPSPSGKYYAADIPLVDLEVVE